MNGGKGLSYKIPKGSNRLKIALRNAANAIGNQKDSDLGKFFKKIAFRKGRKAAISATARKLGVIIYRKYVSDRGIQTDLKPKGRPGRDKRLTKANYQN